MTAFLLRKLIMILHNELLAQNILLKVFCTIARAKCFLSLLNYFPKCAKFDCARLFNALNRRIFSCTMKSTKLFARNILLRVFVQSRVQNFSCIFSYLIVQNSITFVQFFKMSDFFARTRGIFQFLILNTRTLYSE